MIYLAIYYDLRYKNILILVGKDIEMKLPGFKKNLNNDCRLHTSRTLIILISVISACIFCGCSKGSEEAVVVIDAEEDNMNYGLINVVRDDVILSKPLSVTYTQTKEQTVAFSVGGKRITKVHVNPGDPVKVGDLLVELAEGNIAEQIDELEYKINRNQLLLGYLDKAEEFDEQSAYTNFVSSNKNIEEEDAKKFDENQAELKQSYEYRRQDYRDEIEFDQKELAKLKAELGSTKIYSTMNGVVYTVKDYLEGSTSKKDEVIMTIVDNASGFFEISEPTYAKYFNNGEIYEMSVVYGSAQGDYELTPYNMSSWGDTQTFEIVSGPDNEGIEVGTTGTLKIVLEHSDQVLCLPLGAVYYADGKPYVYILDENNFRQMKWIEVGLTGDDKVEVTGGLSEGEKVVYK